MVRDVEIDGGDVRVTIALTIAGCPLRDSFETQVADVLRDVAGVERVALGFDVMTAEERQALTTKLRGGLQERSKGISLDASTRVLAVCSGKGGVGKSTLTANLAVAFAQSGKQVGVLDADVYGHSIPHVLGIHQKPVLVDKMIIPPVKHDLKLMSIGFFLDDNAAGHVAWSDAAPRARAVPHRRALGRARRARRRHAAGNGRRGDLARPAAAACGDDRRHDAAARRAGSRLTRRRDGAEDRHATRRRRREHDRRRLRDRRWRPSRRRARNSAARPRLRSTPCCASAAMQASR